MDLSNVFRLANLVVGVSMILGGIAKFFDRSFPAIVLGVYIILFGLGTIGLEFQIPPYVGRYASFYFSFLGRGIFYVFIGSVILDSSWYNIAAGVVVGVAGAIYIVAEFIPSIEPPANMREADGGWGAEQV